MKEMRPTTGKVLLALFNILGPVYDRSFLDLFSGSGQVSITAARKGAAPVVSVESERKRQAEIAKKAPSGVESLCMDVRRAVQRFSKKGESFDIVFADPPYELGWGKELPALIEKYSEIVSEDGIVVFEHSDREEAADLSAENWEREDRAYGKTVLTFYRRRRSE